MSLADCRVIQLSRIEDARGSLTVVERDDIPFSIRRAYWLYDMPSGSRRGGHAHMTLRQLLIALSGSCNIILDDGHTKGRYRLEHPYVGLYVHTMIWREIETASSDCVLLVFASDQYHESDYFRDYQTFSSAVKSGERQ